MLFIYYFIIYLFLLQKQSKLIEENFRQNQIHMQFNYIKVTNINIFIYFFSKRDNGEYFVLLLEIIV